MDVIAAIATGSAATAIGIVRVSGEGCFALCERVFRAANGRPCGYARCRWVTSGAPRSHPTVSSVIKQNPQMPFMTTEQTSCATRVCRACVE